MSSTTSRQLSKAPEAMAMLLVPCAPSERASRRLRTVRISSPGCSTTQAMNCRQPSTTSDGGDPCPATRVVVNRWAGSAVHPVGAGP